jgi:hypothetical protein
MYRCVNSQRTIVEYVYIDWDITDHEFLFVGFLPIAFRTLFVQTRHSGNSTEISCSVFRLQQSDARNAVSRITNK